jgi:hypothetical protein
MAVTGQRLLAASGQIAMATHTSRTRPQNIADDGYQGDPSDGSALGLTVEGASQAG